MGKLDTLKVVLKDSVNRIPFVGWACQMFGFIFLSRDWEKDKITIETSFKGTESRPNPLHGPLFPGVSLPQ